MSLGREPSPAFTPSWFANQLKFYETLTINKEGKEIPKEQIEKHPSEVLEFLNQENFRNALLFLHISLQYYKLTEEQYVEHLILCCHAHDLLITRLGNNSIVTESIRMHLLTKILALMGLSKFFPATEKYSYLMNIFLVTLTEVSQTKKNMSISQIFRYSFHYDAVVTLNWKKEYGPQILDHLKIAASIDPSNEKLWSLSCAVKTEMADLDPSKRQLLLEEAIRDVNEAIKFSQTTSALQLRAKAYMKFNKYEEAREDILTIFRNEKNENFFPKIWTIFIPIYIEIQQHFILTQNTTPQNISILLKLFDGWKIKKGQNSERETNELLIKTESLLLKRAVKALELKLFDLALQDYQCLAWICIISPTPQLEAKLFPNSFELHISEIKKTLADNNPKKCLTSFSSLLCSLPPLSKIRPDMQLESKQAKSIKDKIIYDISKVKTSANCNIARIYLFDAFRLSHENAALLCLEDREKIIEGCFHFMFALVLEGANSLAKNDPGKAIEFYTLLENINSLRLGILSADQLAIPREKIKNLAKKPIISEQPKIESTQENKLTETKVEKAYISPPPAFTPSWFADQLKFYEQLTPNNDGKEIPKEQIEKYLNKAMEFLDQGNFKGAILFLHNSFQYKLTEEQYVEHLILCCNVYDLVKHTCIVTESIRMHLLTKILALARLSDFFPATEKFDNLMSIFTLTRKRLKESKKDLPVSQVFLYAFHFRSATELNLRRALGPQLFEHLKLAASIDPSDFTLWRLSCLTKIEMANLDPLKRHVLFEDALQDAHEVIKLNPDCSNILMRTRIYVKLNKFSHARKDILTVFRNRTNEKFKVENCFLLLPLYIEIQHHFVPKQNTSPQNITLLAKLFEKLKLDLYTANHEDIKNFIIEAGSILFKRAEKAVELELLDLAFQDYQCLAWLYNFSNQPQFAMKLYPNLPELHISKIKQALADNEMNQCTDLYKSFIGSLPTPRWSRDELGLESKKTKLVKSMMIECISKVRISANKGECDKARMHLFSAFRLFYDDISIMCREDRSVILEGCYHHMFALILEKANNLAKNESDNAFAFYMFLVTLNFMHRGVPSVDQLALPQKKIEQLTQKHYPTEQPKIESKPEEKLSPKILTSNPKPPAEEPRKAIETQAEIKTAEESAPAPVVPARPSKKELKRQKKLENAAKRNLETKEEETPPSPQEEKEAKEPLKVTLPPIAIDAINRLNKAGSRITCAVGGLVCEVIQKINNERTDIDLVFGHSATGDKEADDKANNVLVDEAFKDISEWISNKHGFYKIKLKGCDTTIDLMHSAALADKNLTMAEALKKDSENRDFTMNALYADSHGIVYDPVGRGLKDLGAKLLKSIKESEKSFMHDPIRIFRAIYFYTKRGCRLTGVMKETISKMNPELFSDLLNNQPSKLNVWLRKLLIHGKGKENFTELFELEVLSKFHPALAKLITEFPSDKKLILKQLSTMDASYQKDGRPPNFNAIFAYWMVLIADRYKLDVASVENDGILFKTNFKSLLDHFKDEPGKAVIMKQGLIKKATAFLATVRELEKSSQGLNPKARVYDPKVFGGLSAPSEARSLSFEHKGP